MNGVNWEMILAIKSSLVCGFGVVVLGAGFGLATTLTTGLGSSTTTGAFRIATKFASDVLVSEYPFSLARYLTVIKAPRGST